MDLSSKTELPLLHLQVNRRRGEPIRALADEIPDSVIFICLSFSLNLSQLFTEHSRRLDTKVFQHVLPSGYARLIFSSFESSFVKTLVAMALEIITPSPYSGMSLHPASGDVRQYLSSLEHSFPTDRLSVGQRCTDTGQPPSCGLMVSRILGSLAAQAD